MELIERAVFLASLQSNFNNVKRGEGHCILLSGEAGMGKSSLVKLFCLEKKDECSILQGMCDALYTPRPLAPLYDIASQIRAGALQNDFNSNNRSALFANFFEELVKAGTTLLVFEDVHWADEATLDFIKFLARRITRTRCLFILTYRDDEIYSWHPLKNLLGHLPAGSFTRLPLTPLSKGAVEKLSSEKGYSGEDVYSISGGNPFYVTEILAGYSPGVPDNVKDAIISVYNRQPAETRHIWNIISLAPAGFEMEYLETMEPGYAAAIANSLDAKILVAKEGRLCFKHELYRRAIESNLPLPVNIALNKKILALFLGSFKEKGENERIIHHAKNADDFELVVHYSPLAARQAAVLGSHAEARKLYLTAIEYYRGSDKNNLAAFYESYAYECYLTNHIRDAVVYQEKLLSIIFGQNDPVKTGDCMRFLSRLCWYDGNRKKAEDYGARAIEVLSGQPSSRAKAMALSNMSQLKMLSNELVECIFWGEQAIAMAQELADEEILCHALNNVGTALFDDELSRQKGAALLQQSLGIALKNSYHEHAARAYTNIASTGVNSKNYAVALSVLEEGIHYCEERDLNSWTTYMLSYKARLHLETGQWNEAFAIAVSLIKYEGQATIVKIGATTIIGIIKMRRGEADGLPYLLEAKTKAFETMELQRIIPALAAMLELEWITGKELIDKAEIERAITMTKQMGRAVENSEFAFWLLKARNQAVPLPGLYEGYQVQNKYAAQKAAAIWEQLGCPYEHALTLFEAGETEKLKALVMMQNMGAVAVYNKLKQQMRSSGIKGIPRGVRKTTQANKASLTGREIEVIKLLKEGMQNKEIASRLFISAKTVDHHISAILFKLDVNSRVKAVHEAARLRIID